MFTMCLIETQVTLRRWHSNNPKQCTPPYSIGMDNKGKLDPISKILLKPKPFFVV